MPSSEVRHRTFIGIPVNRALCEFFQQFQQQQQQSPWYPQARWVALPKLHVTLRFLGNITESQLQQIKNGISCLSTAPFKIQCSTPKPFPNVKRPRMLASFVHKNAELEQLALWAETLALETGLAGEKRPYLGHITVARLRHPVSDLQALIRNTDSCPLPVERVVLYQSHHGNNPDIGKSLHTGYEALAEQQLNA
ncbi:MAG: RNA 2',3'-cyclic phosphodiesterase [Gammaproteobacteria bacterium]|nr:RNA 2',3'-cyclic phosphodiesterase [Gammaproteobacteria bacterium]MDH5801690.1 RNA 2',3'-cyclic phosphodiesterase [Gammaproteobacteria bacterium]